MRATEGQGLEGASPSLLLIKLNASMVWTGHIATSLFSITKKTADKGGMSDWTLSKPTSSKYIQLNHISSKRNLSSVNILEEDDGDDGCPLAVNSRPLRSTLIDHSQLLIPTTILTKPHVSSSNFTS